MTKTVFVLVSDSAYMHRAKKTIIDLRSAGQWHGDLVLINVGNAILGSDALNMTVGDNRYYFNTVPL